MKCEHCRQQLLPYLYDLLEPLERDEMVAHLHACPECAEAIESARQQQGMLAEAVMQEHGDIVFKAPSKATPASTAPTIAFQRPAKRVFLLNRWAIAAAILLMLFGTGSVIGWTMWRDRTDALLGTQDRLAKAKQNLAKSQDELNQKKSQSQKEIRAIQEQIDKLFDDWKRDEAKSRKVLEEQGAKLTIKGPQNPVAGANNLYQIDVRQDANFAMQQQDAKNQSQLNQKNLPGVPQQLMNVKAINQKTQKSVFSQQVPIQPNNQANFVLPSDVPIKPNEDIALQFEVPGPDGKLITLTDNLKIAALEYVTHLATDRPLYRPGETVRFRSLTLERFSFKPAQEKFHLRFRIVGPNDVELYNKEAANYVTTPTKKVIMAPNGEELHCLGAGEFTLPKNLAAGKYTLTVSEVNERFNEEKRTFVVKSLQQARFNKELRFHRSSYGAGDQVKMHVRVNPVKGPPGNIKVVANVIVDGAASYAGNGVTDGEGRHTFEFNLPKQIHKEAASVVLECGEGDDSEKIIRDLPLVERDMQVEFFPEGGDLIAGADCRVYFQARTPAGRPADFIGRIVDEKDKEVARIQTVSDDQEPGINQGLGAFTFKPQVKKSYKLRIESPIGIERTIALPEVKADGVVLHLPQSVADKAIDVRLQNVGKARKLLVGAYCRGRMVDTRSVQVGAEQATQVMLRPMPGVGGVYRITVFDWTVVEQENVFRPLAERLIFRKSAEKLNVAIANDRAKYFPGDPVRLSLVARDEKNTLAPSLALVAVVDSSLLKQADEKTARGLPTHFLLTTEIRNPEDIEHADVLLTNHPQAPQSLDLLLGSQGWRRFAEQNPQKFQDRNQQVKQPGFLANTAVVTQYLDTEQKQLDKLDQGYVKKVIEKQRELTEAEKREEAPAELRKVVESSQAQVEETNLQVSQTERRVRELRALLIQFGLGGGLVTLLFVSFYLASIGLRNASEGAGNARPWLIAGGGLFGVLVVGGVIGTFAFMGQNLIDDAPNDHRAKKPPLFVAPVVQDRGPPIDLGDQRDFIAASEPAQARMLKEGPRLAKTRDEEPAKKKTADVPPNYDQPARNEFFKNNDAKDDRQLRQKGDYQTLLLKQLGRRVQLPAVNDPTVVREYAHRRQLGNDERDVATTLYWHPAKLLANGQAHVDFDLPDTVGRFEVLVHSHSFDGRLGTDRIEITSSLPFRIEPGVPEEVSSVDQITVPVAIENDHFRPGALALSARGKEMKVLDKADRKLPLSENLAKREMFQVKPAISDGHGVLRIAGAFERSTAALEHRFKIVPDGLPGGGSIGGVLDNGLAEQQITLPEDMIPGSLSVQAHLYPSALAELQGAIDALAREPATPFKRSLWTLSLNGMALDLMKTNPVHASPPIERRALRAIQGNIHHLTYADRPDDAWTALGLHQTHELDQIAFPTNTRMPHSWRDGKGGFQVQRKDRFVTLDSLTNAYIAWSLAEVGSRDLDKELATIREECKTRKDPYFLALAALSHLNHKLEPDGIAFLVSVRNYQKENGVVTGAITGVTGSKGHDLDVETTALAVLGWLKADRPAEFNASIVSAVKWLHLQRRGPGSYGNSQATILALKAMLAYDQRFPRANIGGEASISTLLVSNTKQDRVSFSSRSQDPLLLTFRGDGSLKSGKNIIRLTTAPGNALPYTLTWSYRTAKPANDPKMPVKLSTKLSRDNAQEGETVTLTVQIENISGARQGETIAIVGLPAGLTLRDKEPAFASKVASWEVRGRELMLIFSNLAPASKVEIAIELSCRTPGSFRGPASQVYGTVDSSRRFWAEPLNIRIDPVK